MTFLIAAAGTGGHVFPGLAVGEALVDLGVSRTDVLFVGGDRLEASVYPEEGFPFLQVEIRGLKRSLAVENLGLPVVVARARRKIIGAIEERGIAAGLGMGGYVTLPASMACSKKGIPFMVSEQNADAGMANRIAGRRAARRFGSFPETEGLDAEWVGNPVREAFWQFDRDQLRAQARHRYGLRDELPTLGVFGGSLGAKAINDVIAHCVSTWTGPEVQVLHLTGSIHHDDMMSRSTPPSVTWRRVAFEDSMELFFAASDLVVARAGGAVAEITATETPSILVPGEFGSAGHQARNAACLHDYEAALVVPESVIDRLCRVIGEVLFDAKALDAMRRGARRIAKPEAAHTIAKALIEAA